MIAWKFLRAGAISPVTRFAWPAPGTWADAHAAPKGCRAGFHACRAEDLACWICDELWEMELDGPIEPAIDAIVAPRARLLRPIDAWRGEGGEGFLAFCVAQAERALEDALPDAVERMTPFVSTTQKAANRGNKPIAAYASASAAGVIVPDLEEQARLFREERARQSAWIATELL